MTSAQVKELLERGLSDMLQAGASSNRGYPASSKRPPSSSLCNRFSMERVISNSNLIELWITTLGDQGSQVRVLSPRPR
jgi:hypothetical protein